MAPLPFFALSLSVANANTHTQKQSFAQYLPTSLTRTFTQIIEVHKKQPIKLISSSTSLSSSHPPSLVFMASVVLRQISLAEVNELPGQPEWKNVSDTVKDFAIT